MRVETVGIIGYGNFGALAHTLLRRFAPHLSVFVYSKDKKQDQKIFFPLEDVAACDAVILAVPIRAFESVLTKILPLTKPDTVIIDVATVKVHTVALLRKLARGRRYIATHPVWGPESYKKRSGDVSGFRIVVSEHTIKKEEFKALAALMRSLGFDIVETSAEAHDKHLAESLFLTHFIGQLVTRGGFSRSEVDTVSFEYLMDAVESVKNDEALFRDVFRFNPYCKDVLRKIAAAEISTRRLLSVGEKDGPIVIGVSGAKGSFSEEAARAYAKKSHIKKIEISYLISVENVLSALESGEIGLGIFPIENSIGGVVNEAVEAMSKHNFDIKKTFDIMIKQNLLAKPGTKSDDIKVITSHEQALLQCKSYLKKKWGKVKIKPYSDTAKAAEDLASGKLPPTTAVIASRTAAKLYGLKILDAAIQDLKTNHTTFIAAKAL